MFNEQLNSYYSIHLYHVWYVAFDKIERFDEHDFNIIILVKAVLVIEIYNG